MNEPKGCPTPGACSALDQIATLTKERDELCALLEQAEKALENAIAKNEMYIGVTQQEEAVSAIKQWKEKT